MWYDGRDNLIKQKSPGGVNAKVVYDGVSRQIKQYTTDGGGDVAPGVSGTWATAGNVTDDIVLEQVETTYDKDDNAILITTKERWHNAEGTGDLQPGLSIVDTSHANARVSFVANWFDEANRMITTVNYGNNGNNGDANGDGVVEFHASNKPTSTRGYRQDGTRTWSPVTHTILKAIPFTIHWNRANKTATVEIEGESIPLRLAR